MAFTELVEATVGIHKTTAYRYMVVAKLVDDFPNLMHCANNWTQLHLHHVEIRQRINQLGKGCVRQQAFDDLGMAGRFKAFDTGISFVPSSTPLLVPVNPAGALFQGDDVDAKEMGVDVKNHVKYCGTDFVEHDAILHHRLLATDAEAEAEPAEPMDCVKEVIMSASEARLQNAVTNADNATHQLFSDPTDEDALADIQDTIDREKRMAQQFVDTVEGIRAMNMNIE